MYAIAKEMKKKIKEYLKSIRLTGSAIPQGRQQEMVKYCFNDIGKKLKFHEWKLGLREDF